MTIVFDRRPDRMIRKSNEKPRLFRTGVFPSPYLREPILTNQFRASQAPSAPISFKPYNE
jgi:hypothetical protein